MRKRKPLLDFVQVDAPGRKTLRWEVRGVDSRVLLGHVEWMTHWRRYCFYPLPLTLFDEYCLHDLANFCRRKTDERRLRRAIEKARAAGRGAGA